MNPSQDKFYNTGSASVGVSTNLDSLFKDETPQNFASGVTASGQSAILRPNLQNNFYYNFNNNYCAETAPVTNIAGKQVKSIEI